MSKKGNTYSCRILPGSEWEDGLLVCACVREQGEGDEERESGRAHV